MNKKELAMVEELKTRLALRFTGDGPIEPDVPIPFNFSELSTGYLFNSYSKIVSPACSSSGFHARGRTDKTDSQRPVRLYSTRKLALQAMRLEVELRCARELREIDAKIEAEETTPQG
jgi:hypothetical protein